MPTLAGKVAVITGGASGIGAGTARYFVEQGARVVVADLLDEEGRALCESLGEAADYVHCDVTVEGDVQAAVARASERFGRFDCIFNNAGSSGVYGPIAETPVDGFDRAMAVLLRGVFLGMKHAAPVLTAQRSGSIISTASVAGLGVGHGPHVYSAAKAAVIHLTRSVASELGEHNVRVNCICPGGIATPIFARTFGLEQEDANRTVDLMSKVLAAAQPVPRAGTPLDIAKAAAWLASDDSTFVTGHALVVDGGVLGGLKWSARQEQGEQLRNALLNAGAKRG
jgi:NAD(P)-dependent dehydrogenase (short-subunit alcohol dehydrogenase family)